MSDGTFTTGLFYASSIRACDLVAAGRTFALVEPTLRALDLLALRKRTNTLVIGPGPSASTVTAVPVEVWGLVKQVVIEGELERVRLALRGDGPDESCGIELMSDEEEREDENGDNTEDKAGSQAKEEGEESDWGSGVRRAKRKEAWTVDWIDSQWRGNEDDLDCGFWVFNNLKLDELGPVLDRLLASYGLRLPIAMDMFFAHHALPPPAEGHAGRAGDDGDSDADSENDGGDADVDEVVSGARDVPRSDHLTNIALARRNKTGPRYRTEARFRPAPSHWADGMYDGGAEIAVPDGAFDLPDNAQARFAKFARVYHIDTNKLEGLRSSRPQWKVLTKMHPRPGL